MYISLDKLIEKKQSQVKINETIDINEINANGRKLKFTKPIYVVGNIYVTDNGIFIHADIEYEVINKCDRCLKEYKENSKAIMSGKIINKDDKNNEDEEQIFFSKNEEFNLDEAIKTTIIFSEPMKTLCKEDCKGLCQKCGKNLNEGPCECEHEDIDPRLAKLKDLME